MYKRVAFGNTKEYIINYNNDITYKKNILLADKIDRIKQILVNNDKNDDSDYEYY